MFTINENTLTVTLPEGMTQVELIFLCKKEIRSLISQGVLYGKHLLITGRITTGMALVLGHELAHITKSVSIFDPKENAYALCIEH